MKKLTNQTPDTRDADDEFVESYGVSVDEHNFFPKLTEASVCVNCDKLKSCSNICMDCIKKIVEENQQLTPKPTDEQIENYINDHYEPYYIGDKNVNEHFNKCLIKELKAYRDGRIAEWVKNAT
jgi:hypothetical protein